MIVLSSIFSVLVTYTIINLVAKRLDKQVVSSEKVIFINVARGA